MWKFLKLNGQHAQQTLDIFGTVLLLRSFELRWPKSDNGIDCAVSCMGFESVKQLFQLECNFAPNHNVAGHASGFERV